MYATARAACWSSFGTVRKKNPRRVPDVVSLVAVAVPEMFATPPLRNGAVETSTSWLPAGPTTARTCWFDARFSATRTACAVSGSCVSPRTSRMSSLCARFQRVSANLPHLCICCPSGPAGPVTGAANPTDTRFPQVIAALSAAAGAAADRVAVAPRTAASARRADSRAPRAA